MRKAILLFGALSLMVPASVFAAEETQTMEEMVVTATRTEQAVEKVPAQVTVITRDQIEASGAQTIPDVLGNLAGVFVSDLNGNGQNQTVDMGGFGETANRHVAVVIDGRRINPIDQSGPGWTSISLDNVERIEVLSGAGSVLYGDQAMSGVVNIITRTPQEGVQVKLEAGAGDSGAHRFSASLNHGTATGGMFLTAGTQDSEGYRDNSASEQQSFSAKFTQQFSDRLSGRIQLDHTTAEYEFPGSLTAAQMAQRRTQTTTPNDYGASDANTLAAGVELDLGRTGKFDLGISYRNEQREAYMWWTYSYYDMATLGLNAKYVLDEPIAGFGNRLTIGADFYNDDYDLDRGFAPAVRTDHFRHQRKSLAGYVQDELTLFDRLTLNLGFRSEKPDTELRSDKAGAKKSVDKDKADYAWNMGLSYNFMEHSKVYARAYRSFRFPVVDEYTSLWTGAINADLEPQTSIGYEAGLRVKPMDALRVSFRAFLFDVDDEIAWTGAQNENIGETRHQGGEFSLRFAPTDSVALYGSTAYTDVEFTKAANAANNGKTVPLVPEWKSHLGIDLRCPMGFRYRVQYNHVDEQYQGTDYANAQPKMEAYETVDMYLTYRLKKAELFVNATNVFNEEYSTAGWVGGYYPMPEAVYYGGVRLKF